MATALSAVEQLIVDAESGSHDDAAKDPTEGKSAPHDLDAEASVLATVTLDPAGLAKVSEFLKPIHFHSEAHRWIFEAAIELTKKKTPVDVVSIATWLKDNERIGQVGGMIYLTELLNCGPVVANVKTHAETVVNKWRVRSLILRCQEIVGRGYGNYGDAQTFLDESARAVVGISRSNVRNEIEHNAATLRRLVKSITASSMGIADADRARTGILTGLKGYDKLVHGLHAGQKTLIVALPKIGKTALILQILAYIASTGIGAALFSQEMTREELFMRLLSAWAVVDGDRMKGAMAGTVTLTQQEMDRIEIAEAEIAKLPLVIDYCPGINRDELRSRSLLLVDEMRVLHGVPLGVIGLDYIQRMPGLPSEQAAVARGQMKKHEFIARNSNAFTMILQELKIPGIELAQRKPAPVDGKTKVRPKPTQGQTADCSDIEREAQQIAYLYRLPKKDPAGMRVIGEDKTRLGLMLVEQRNGAGGGEAILRFEGEYSRFTDAPDERLTPVRQYVEQPASDDDDDADDDQTALLPKEKPTKPKKWIDPATGKAPT